MLYSRISIFKIDNCVFYLSLTLIWEFILISWVLATGIFPYYYKYLSYLTYWWMGLTGAAGILSSVIIPDIMRTLIWNKFGLSNREVTFFIWGAVTDAELKKENTYKEVVLLLVGVIANIITAIIMHCVIIISPQLSLPIEIMGVFEFTRMINIGLAVISFFPLYPFYGSRLIILIFYRIWSNDKKNAFLSSLSNITGLMIMTAGLMLCVRGLFHGGIWWILFGLFLREGNGLIQRKYEIKRLLKKNTVSEIMTDQPVYLYPDQSIDTFINEYLYCYHYKIYPVIDCEHKVCGVLFSSDAISLHQKDRLKFTVGEIAVTRIGEIAVTKDAEVLEVIRKMYENNQSRLIVIDEENHLAGVIVIKDLLMYVTSKMGIPS